MGIELNSMIPVIKKSYKGENLVLGYADQFVYDHYDLTPTYVSLYTSEAGSKALRLKESNNNYWWEFGGFSCGLTLSNKIVQTTRPNIYHLRRTITTSKIRDTDLYKMVTYSDLDDLTSLYREEMFSRVMKKISDHNLKFLRDRDFGYSCMKFSLYIKLMDLMPYFLGRNVFSKANDPYHCNLEEGLKGSSRYYFEVLKAVNEYIYKNEEFQDKIFNIIKKVSVFPFSKTWINHLIKEEKISFRLFYAAYADIENPENIYGVTMTFELNSVFRELQNALRLHTIDIGVPMNALNKNKEIPQDIAKYLEKYSGELVNRINDKFTPLFSPLSDKFTEKELNYFEYTKTFTEINFRTAQKNIIGSISRSIQRNGNSIIVGEMGVGKTAMSIGSLYAFEKKCNPFNIVMAPGHLVEKWKREIENLYPGAVAYIVDSLTSLNKLDSKIRDKKREYPLFLVISKDTAKINYAIQPIPKYNKRNHCYVCPHCGQFSGDFASSDNKKAEQSVLMYGSKDNKNSVCSNCGSALWGSACNDNSSWVKLKNGKFVNMDIYDDFEDFARTTLDTKMASIYKEMTEIKRNGAPVIVSPRRYSIAKYIKNKYKGLIDTFIADEVHLYSSSQSYQAEAFGDIVKAAKRTVALTGTLLNGYSTSIYHILFRMYPSLFRKKGYTYASVNKFAEDFGSTCETITYNTSSLRNKKSKKIIPGVSPKVFTDFLLDKSVFVSLSDMNTDMASYKEIPVAIELEKEEKAEYDKIMGQIKAHIERNTSNRFDSVFQMIQRTNMYLDQPFDIPPIADENNGVLLKYNNLFENEDLKEDYMSSKDEKLFEIVKEKIDKGENVLIYVNYVNSTDCVKRLKKMFDLAEIPNAVLTSSVAAKEREKWIDSAVKDGCRVLICNPSLVETGLDLLAFTNIIFYQMGYNLFTMRQASRRSLRLNQTNNVTVYFLYFKDTIQESVLSLMASKLQASMAIEGKFSKEGLNELTNNDSILTQVANSIVKDIEHKIDEGTFKNELTSPDSDFKLINMINEKEVKSLATIFTKKKSKKNINLSKLISDYQIAMAS